ncbi:hypothetical protein AZO1586I_823 [Bathymodiolus thermophilus thioautotrophic gill symbiont]|jgi:hypothetical protein|uniref:CobQ/CobB/MinD/ParA nucleotide binding domain-containing protein n=2 Tax=sulfur-oxidizing symbionts TaxID=32036 RepID=A0A1H6J5M3_9GAMM|nr:hypothetical protein [Bathymodiolus thermophilus thioautotrophic gill symbiont]CAC9476285.1 hypothetical protein [uncultured Gammaproteobacteria bacterium]SEH55580.1 hypothetical protein BAZSYMB_V2GCONTIG00716_1 [Bathymodiolus azoricus thioautotrophic gill symbiont]CAB5501518.1 hypothetical protein AZO1586I_823 [Bathymodiolus thermophilus thioautotrophic gill symbiont]CAC9528738.1 hypothetical protein [uncultured Gammaproteobacteria bacterium]CAC9548182.1 hypothetical protein [uncultured Ga
MNILFYSAIGRQGKTTNAIGYAKHTKAKYYTNDLQNATKELYGDMFKTGDFVEIEIGKEITIDDKDNIVFDFGGYIDSRLIDVIQYVDICVVPISYQSKSEYIPTVKTINAILEHNKNVVILINNTATKLIGEVKEALNYAFPKLPIFTINSSRYISRLANHQKTIFDLLEKGGGLEKHFIKKSLIPQIKKFYNYLDNNT